MTASAETPAGKVQYLSVWSQDYVAPDEVRTFDTFEAFAGHTADGVVRVYAGNGKTDDPSGAAFDFRGDRLIGYGARVTAENMASIRAALATVQS